MDFGSCLLQKWRKRFYFHDFYFTRVDKPEFSYAPKMEQVKAAIRNRLHQKIYQAFCFVPKMAQSFSKIQK